MPKLKVLFALFISFSFCIPVQAKTDFKQSRYKLYCMYTPKFERLYTDYFLPSLKDDFEVVVKYYPQDCSSGIFRAEGWEKTMLQKLELLLEAIEDNWNEVFFYSDIDIIFFKPILETALHCLRDLDFVVQQGWPRKEICAGFFVMRGNEKTRNLITTAYNLLEERAYLDDQLALQATLNRLSQKEIAWRFLPFYQFPNGRRVLRNSNGYYSEKSRIILDNDIFLFHATSCIGIENKYQFLERVLQEYKKKNSFRKNL